MEYPGDFAKVLAVVVAVAIGYGVVNFFALLTGRAPGMAALVAWTFILPALMAAGHWATLAFYRSWSGAWWQVALAATGFYALAGFLSYRMILAIWAAV